MSLIRVRIPRLAPLLTLALGLMILPASSAKAQYLGYGGSGYGGLGYGGFGYGGLGFGYGGYGGYGGFGGLGYGGLGGFGIGGFDGYGYGYGFAYAGQAYTNYIGANLGGLGYPGISLRNPYFSAGTSPLAVQNVFLERSLFGRTTPAHGPVQGYQGVSVPASTPVPVSTRSAPVGMGTFSVR
jgi:hypothetical protein